MSRSGGQVLLYSQREKSKEELKSKGRRERERQWVSKVKGSSVFQNISGNGRSLEGGVNLFFIVAVHRWAG